MQEQQDDTILPHWKDEEMLALRYSPIILSRQHYKNNIQQHHNKNIVMTLV